MAKQFQSYIQPTFIYGLMSCSLEVHLPQLSFLLRKKPNSHKFIGKKENVINGALMNHK